MPDKDSEKFDFVNFDYNQEQPKEKINWLMLPVYFLGWIGFKLMFVLPFLLGVWLSGRNFLGFINGLILFAICWYLFYRIFDR